MRQWLEDREHLLRLAGLFAAALIGFVVLRGLFVPEGFGELGHYRTGALADNQAAPIVHAGAAACADCHATVLDERRGSKHQGIRCESCHGPLGAHASDPSSAAAARPDVSGLCVRCHLSDPARPTWFPQVDADDHAGGDACDSCHRPHRPGIE